MTTSQVPRLQLDSGKREDVAVPVSMSAGDAAGPAVRGLQRTTLLIAIWLLVTAAFAVCGFALGVALFSDGVFTARSLADGAVTTAKVGSAAITPITIASGAVLADKLADKSVTTRSIDNFAVVSANLAVGAVTRNTIAVEAVDSARIAPGAILNDKLAAGSISSDKLALTGNVTISASSDAAGTNTGALRVTGGGSFGKNLHVGSNLHVAGYVSRQYVTDVDVSATALVPSQGISIITKGGTTGGVTMPTWANGVTYVICLTDTTSTTLRANSLNFRQGSSRTTSYTLSAGCVTIMGVNIAGAHEWLIVAKV